MRPAARLVLEATRLRLSFELVVERRLLGVVLADVVLLLQGVVAAFVSNGEPGAVYFWVVVVPLLGLAVPILSNAVPLERRSGSLDLVLASPSAHSFLVRRVASVCAVAVLQGWLMLGLTRLLGARPFPVAFPVVQVLLVSCLVGAVTLFWNLRLKSTGAILLASLVTLLALGRWLFAPPVPDPQAGAAGIRTWVETNLVLATTGTIFYLYARRRLGRSEALLGD